MDYTYKVGDKVLLKSHADTSYNTELNRGKEVTIVKIDYRDCFYPYKIQTLKGHWFWVSPNDIECMYNLLGLRL